MGRPKQLALLAGRPLLQHVVDVAAGAALDELIVVVGHVSTEVMQGIRLPEGARFVPNPMYRDGQSTSLKCGLRAAHPRAQGALVMLGDQPAIRPDAIGAVTRTWRERRPAVAQASYGGRPGHPILLSRTVWTEVHRISGDRGARDVLGAHPDWTLAVEVGGEPPADIDTEQDLSLAEAGRGPGPSRC